MGYPARREFVYPQLLRMYGTVREAGKHVMTHSCGKVDELFGDLIQAGLNCFNPFQPEVMDVEDCGPVVAADFPFMAACRPNAPLPYGNAPGMVET